MNIWDILGTPMTGDIREIKRAYARQSKTVHPEDDPQGFQRLRDAYETALRYAQFSSAAHAAPDVADETADSETTAFAPQIITVAPKDEKIVRDEIDFDKILEEQVYKNSQEAIDLLKALCSPPSINLNSIKAWEEYFAAPAFIAACRSEEFLCEFKEILQTYGHKLTEKTCSGIEKLFNRHRISSTADPESFAAVLVQIRKHRRISHASEFPHIRRRNTTLSIVAVISALVFFLLVLPVILNGGGSQTYDEPLKPYDPYSFSSFDMLTFNNPYEHPLVEATTYTVQKVSAETETLRLVLPKVGGLSDPAIQIHVNEAINHAMLTACSLARPTENDTSPLLSTRFKVVYRTEMFLSIIFEGTFDQKDSNWNVIGTVNIDMTSGQVVRLSDRYNIDTDFTDAFFVDHSFDYLQSLFFRWLCEDNPYPGEWAKLVETADYESDRSLKIFSYYTKDKVGISIYDAGVLLQQEQFEVDIKALEPFEK